MSKFTTKSIETMLKKSSAKPLLNEKQSIIELTKIINSLDLEAKDILKINPFPKKNGWTFYSIFLGSLIKNTEKFVVNLKINPGQNSFVEISENDNFNNKKLYSTSALEEILFDINKNKRVLEKYS